ncbi:hypothetical protein F5Y17DRAFT_454034 [Xylariaceae sp. FL0594]|nr:hypothetical protein F5Y17DRAFT_454034 [Xylariaceae sp. FL0594]
MSASGSAHDVVVVGGGGGGGDAAAAQLPPGFEIRPLTLEHLEPAKEIFAHSMIYDSPLWSGLYTRDQETRFQSLCRASHFMVKRQIESGLSLGVFDTWRHASESDEKGKNAAISRPRRGEKKNARSRSLGCGNGANDNNLRKGEETVQSDQSQRERELANSSLASIALGFDAYHPIDQRFVAPVMGSLPASTHFFEELQKRNPVVTCRRKASSSSSPPPSSSAGNNNDRDKDGDNHSHGNGQRRARGRSHSGMPDDSGIPQRSRSRSRRSSRCSSSSSSSSTSTITPKSMSSSVSSSHASPERNGGYTYTCFNAQSADEGQERREQQEGAEDLLLSQIRPDPTGPNQVLKRMGTATRHEYQGYGLMRALSHHMMRFAADKGFREIHIDCLHDSVTGVWSRPPEPFRAVVACSVDVWDIEAEEEEEEEDFSELDDFDDDSSEDGDDCVGRIAMIVEQLEKVQIEEEAEKERRRFPYRPVRQTISKIYVLLQQGE